MGDQYDTISACTEANKHSISKLQDEVKSLTEANASLKSDNESFSESIIDLKCRSMRDNLLFFGVTEGRRFDPVPHPKNNPTDPGAVSVELTDMPKDASTSRPNTDPSVPLSDPVTFASVSASAPLENCAEKVFTFCEKLLNISDPKSKIKIIRAHRIGKPTPGRIRPIVAKFDTDSKMLIKSSLKHVSFQFTEYNVSEQYPQEVKDRRKELIPVMLQARKAGKRAVLVRDKLFINNIQYNGENTK